MKIFTLPLLALCLTASVRAEDAKPAAKPAASKPAKKAKKEAVKAAEAAEEAKSLHEKFQALDTNKDGVIDKAELAAYEKLVTDEADKTAKKHDEKKDAELKSELEVEYQKEDQAHDGKVTEAEFSKEAK
jgi:hypothetical protein